MKEETKAPAVELTLVDSKLETAIRQANLEPASAEGLLSTFRPLFAKANGICADAANLAVTDATQLTEMKRARELRLGLRAVRIEAEKTRKALKEDSLRRGKAIDGVYNVLEYAVAPVEAKLLEMEEFAARAEAARKAAIKAKREELLQPYGIDLQFYPLGEMSDAAFTQLFDATQFAHEAKAAAAKKAEEERVAKEKAEAAERERVRVENERLKKEAAEKEAALRAEREEAEKILAAERRIAAEQAAAAKAKADAERRALEEKARKEQEELHRRAAAERAAREKLEAEARARKEAEERRQREEAEAAARAAAAPDQEKLRALAALVRTVECPEMATPSGRIAGKEVAALIEELAMSIEGIAHRLSRPSRTSQKEAA